jgi:hypothetical protein
MTPLVFDHNFAQIQNNFYKHALSQIVQTAEKHLGTSDCGLFTLAGTPVTSLDQIKDRHLILT